MQRSITLKLEGNDGNTYRHVQRATELAHAICEVLSVKDVVANRAAAELGLSVLEAGGDFADGVIAFEGRWLGGEAFVSFDRKAVVLLRASGQAAQLL